MRSKILGDKGAGFVHWKLFSPSHTPTYFPLNYLFTFSTDPFYAIPNVGEPPNQVDTIL